MIYRNLPKFNKENSVHFITSKTYNKCPYFKDEKCCQILSEEIKFYQRKYNLKVLGHVIMPDHWHALIWWDVEKYPKLTISKIVQGIKGHSARQIIDYLKPLGRLEPRLQPIQSGFEQRLKPTRSGMEQEVKPTRSGEKQRLRPIHLDNHRRGLKYRVWQPGLYDFNVYKEKRLIEKLKYIYENPIKAGLIENLEDYRWSSYKRSVD